MYLIETFNKKEDDKLIDIENGGIYEAMMECDLAIYNMLESMYEMDMKEILEVTDEDVKNKDNAQDIEYEEVNKDDDKKQSDSKEDIKSSNNKVTSGMKAKLKATLATMKKAILTILNSLLNFIDKMRFNNKKFVEKYKGMRDKFPTEAIEIEGYEFPNKINDVDLKKALTLMTNKIGVCPEDFVNKYKNVDGISQYFKEVWLNASADVVDYLSNGKIRFITTRTIYPKEFKLAAFGSEDKHKIRVSANDALNLLDGSLDEKIKHLRKQKVETETIFNKLTRDIEKGGSSSNAIKISGQFMKALNFVKTLYLSRINEEIKATKAQILQCQQVVKNAAKKASVNDEKDQ